MKPHTQYYESPCQLPILYTYCNNNIIIIICCIGAVATKPEALLDDAEQLTKI